MKAKQVKYWNWGYRTLMISLDSLTNGGGGGGGDNQYLQLLTGKTCCGFGFRSTQLTERF